eukprot:TRINITY_DN21963_c0_g1_i1.p1 TRINITY_DN21963_c0_g1~~TRINITY_DN21963_c0_g1_i1.p1  ORF type:complete len:297 (-),score=101.89 TRINITY_DN21963_c0_g1_i1:85-975(-)
MDGGVVDEPKRLLGEAQESLDKEKAKGIVFIARVPPYMKAPKLRHLMSQYGHVERIYLRPEDPAVRGRRVRDGGKKKRKFVDGWIEFSEKKTARRVAESLNNQIVGGKKRSPHYYDMWNLKYLPGFHWSDLVEELGTKPVIKELRIRAKVAKTQKEANEIVRDIESSKKLARIRERVEKRRKMDSGDRSETWLESAPVDAIDRVKRKMDVSRKAKTSKPGAEENSSLDKSGMIDSTILTKIFKSKRKAPSGLMQDGTEGRTASSGKKTGRISSNGSGTHDIALFSNPRKRRKQVEE